MDTPQSLRCFIMFLRDEYGFLHLSQMCLVFWLLPSRDDAVGDSVVAPSTDFGEPARRSIDVGMLDDRATLSCGPPAASLGARRRARPISIRRVAQPNRRQSK